MSKEGQREFLKWAHLKYPYDAAECKFCATGHKISRCEHREMIKVALKMNIDTREIERHPRRSRRLILAFRKKFARFYPRRGSK